MKIIFNTLVIKYNYKNISFLRNRHPEEGFVGRLNTSLFDLMP